MKRHGFSMIELVFVIVILGVLAAVAVPKFVSSRTDAQVATLRSDMATVLKTVPSRVFAENIDVSTTPPGTDSSTGNTFQNWGEWIVDTAGLDKTKWKVDGNGISPIYEVDAADPNNSKGCGKVIEINPPANNNPPATITFDPETQLTVDNALCKGLKNSYPSGSKRVIPLGSTGSVIF